MSSLGTTLNGRHVPRGYDEVDGSKRENGTETALPDTARIGLADLVFLDFGSHGDDRSAVGAVDLPVILIALVAMFAWTAYHSENRK